MLIKCFTCLIILFLFSLHFSTPTEPVHRHDGNFWSFNLSSLPQAPLLPLPCSFIWPCSQLRASDRHFKHALPRSRHLFHPSPPWFSCFNLLTEVNPSIVKSSSISPLYFRISFWSELAFSSSFSCLCFVVLISNKCPYCFSKTNF